MTDDVDMADQLTTTAGTVVVLDEALYSKTMSADADDEAAGFGPKKSSSDRYEFVLNSPVFPYIIPSKNE